MLCYNVPSDQNGRLLQNYRPSGTGEGGTPLMKNQKFTTEFFYFSYGFTSFYGKAFWGFSAEGESTVLA